MTSFRRGLLSALDYVFTNARLNHTPIYDKVKRAEYRKGDKVKVDKPGSNKDLLHGTVEAISRDYAYPRSITYGVALENLGGLYYFQAHELESRT